MKILIIDPPGSGLSWGMNCMADGHDVRIFIAQNKKTENIARDIIPFADDWRDWIRWADLVFLTDNTKYMRELDSWRTEGIKICGPTDASAEWELDRERGQEIFEKCGVNTIPGETFTNYDKAIEYVKKNGKRYVSKPSGDADKALSYVSKSPADMVFMLERWKDNGKMKSAPFILQEFKAGIEMAVGGWFGPGGFNHGWCENFEFKKLMDGDKGPNTGEQGTVMRYVSESKLADDVLSPVEKELAKTGHTGYIDVNCIIDENGKAWPLEFTMRPGWPCYNIQQELHEGDHAEWLLDLAEGRDAGNLILDTVATGVVMAIPDYPYSHITRKEVTGLPLYGLTKSLMPHVHPCEMMAGEAPHNTPTGVKNKDCLVTAGDYVLVASGTGETVRQSKKAAYRILDKLDMPNSPFWRTDIGDRLSKQLTILQSYGYATEMLFS
jgi:phosphoribosylamine--glycine ligase